MRAMRWPLVLILLSACDCGESSPRVPFKLAKTAPSAEGTTNEGAPLAPSVDQFDKPVDHPKVDDLATPFVATRTLLALDLDADQDRDVIAVVNHTEESIALAAALRDGNSFGAAQMLQGFGLAQGCEPTALSLSAVSSTKGRFAVDATCGPEKAAQPHAELLFAIDAKPYLLERLAVTPAEPEASSVALAFSSVDSDGDAHDDVAIQVTLTPPQGTPISERIVLLDRGRSLAFDAAGFESVLVTRADQAKTRIRKVPADAASEAYAVISLFEAVCRDGGRARLQVGSEQGLPCAPSKALAKAYATWIATLAPKQQLVGALDAYLALSHLPLEGREIKQALTDATRALAGLKARADITLSEGPAVSEAQSMLVRLPSARFITDELLYVRRDPAVVYHVEQGSEVAAPMADDRVLDPSGSLAVTAIERRCSGLFLQIERSSDRNPPGIAARPVSTPALRIDDASCTDTPQTRRKDSAGYRVLGWAPQGVLAARGSEVVLVPLSIEGAATGEPRVLDALTPRPAPLAQGRASSDAAHYAWLAPFGVVVFDNAGKAELWRPKGFDAIAAAASDVAISPSGKRVAVTSGGRVYLLGAAPSPAKGP